MKKGIKIIITLLSIFAIFYSEKVEADIVEDKARSGIEIKNFNWYRNSTNGKLLGIVEFSDGTYYYYDENNRGENEMSYNHALNETGVNFNDPNTFSQYVGGTATGSPLSQSTIYECGDAKLINNIIFNDVYIKSTIPYSFAKPVFPSGTVTSNGQQFECTNYVEYELAFSSQTEDLQSKIDSIIDEVCPESSEYDYLNDPKIKTELARYERMLEECIEGPQGRDVNLWYDYYAPQLHGAESMLERFNNYFNSASTNDECEEFKNSGSSGYSNAINNLYEQIGGNSKYGSYFAEGSGASQGILESYLSQAINKNTLPSNIDYSTGQLGRLAELCKQKVEEVEDELNEENKEDFEKLKPEIDKMQEYIADWQAIKDHMVTYSKTEVWTGSCEDLITGELKELIQEIMSYVRTIVVVLVIVMGMLDFAKAVFASNADNMKKAQMTFVKRLIIAVAIFFVPLLTEIILNAANSVWSWIDPSCGL